MTNIILFLSTAFIWGTTWLAIKYQLGTVHPLWSVCYRFALAGLILLAFCQFKGLSLKFSKRDHQWIALQAFLLFSLNYFFYYLGTDYFVSGIVAVIFAAVAIFNIFNARVFLKIPLSKSAIAGAIIGLGGLGVIFRMEICRLIDTDIWTVLTGLSICLLGTIIASIGQIVATANMKRALPYLQTNAIGMTYGGLYTALGAIFIGEVPTFELTAKYTLSLLYLTLAGTVIAFGLYMKLVQNIGPSKASYAFVLIPVVALTVSTLFENFTWTMETVIGIGLVILGNIVVMISKTLQSRGKIEPLQDETLKKAA
ncbi:DMT family transporter [Candidatus Odyssella acanthamoebae]|uniref:DMT family transporter n=1 Tax=Candidatus Odyssella acanthamoebae TaxID=91604 RepID=UPI00056FD96D|nr:EamA family transporter [Candidatus Paracaedibacter acanthamoebae]